MTEHEENSGKDTGHGIPAAGAARALAAAAVTAAASYAVQRALTHRNESDDGNADATQDQHSEADDREHPDRKTALLAKKDELSDTLATKVSDAKEKAKQLRPGNRNPKLSWESATEHLLPVAGEAAAALGKKAGKQAPELVRTQLIPKFIEGFESTR